MYRTLVPLDGAFDCLGVHRQHSFRRRVPVNDEANVQSPEVGDVRPHRDTLHAEHSLHSSGGPSSVQKEQSLNSLATRSDLLANGAVLQR